MLPYVPPDHPHAAEWRMRRESYQHLLSHVLPGVELEANLRVLDLGAGNLWLSHRLASLGHRVVAVDWFDDEADGLGACRQYPVSFLAVQADFDALPFRPFQFELVVFNGSLHYVTDIAATLARAREMLAPGGSLVVMDSPMFRREADGHAMVVEKLRQFKDAYGLTTVVHPQIGFLTFELLAQAASALGLRAQFFRSRGPLGWRVRRPLAWMRLRRAPAAFGVWVAQARAESRAQ